MDFNDMKLFGIVCMSVLLLTVEGFIIGKGTGDGQILANELGKVADAVGMTYMQAEYDKMTYKERDVNGDRILDVIVESLTSQFTQMENAITATRRVLEEKYSEFGSTPTMTECCKETGMAIDSRFNANISLERGCLAISKAASAQRVYPSVAVVEKMKENRENDPTLLWQYYGSKDGVLLNYPASNLSNCDVYDPRFRQYFVSTSSPVHKDVVILFETSSSMKDKPLISSNPKPLIQLVKESLATVLNTLGPMDRVGIVGFNGEAYTPTLACEGDTDTLARATTDNINDMKNFINNRGADGQADYVKAFTKAFKFFNNSDESLQGEKRDKILLFLTSGTSATGDPLPIIRSSNLALQNSVIIHVFQLGPSQSLKSENLLKNISEQTLSEGTVRGHYEKVLEEARLTAAMAEYYTYSSNQRLADPVFSAPFVDYFSHKGLLSAMCLPVNQGGEFKGVVCTDFRLNELLSKVTYLHEGDNTYAFVIDGFGRTLVHPLLPQRPESTENPSVVDIENFERMSDVKEVIQSMKLGGSGSKTGVATRLAISRGVMLHEGDRSKNIKANYYWRQVAKSNFSVCVVIGEDVTKLRELDNVAKDRQGFFYHNREVQDYGATPCRHYSRWASKDHTCVMLAPSSFSDPIKYMYEKETPSKIKTYEDFLRGDVDFNPGLVDTILYSVAATYKAEMFWKNSLSSDNAKFVIWRYICTRDGITRMYPCVQLTKDYDPKLRPWYQRTIAKQKKFVVSAPYYDAWGSGYLITLSRTLYEGKRGGVHSTSDSIVGVAGTDFTINYFNQLLQNIYPECGETDKYSCIVIDDSGFLVMHPDFVVTRSDPGLEYSIHIASKEGEIARDLISKNIMYQEPCLDTEYKKEQYTYRITFDKAAAGLDRMAVKGYEIIPVPDSVIAIILKRRSSLSSTCCSNPEKSPTVNQCSKDLCDCLCYKQVNFSVCENKYSPGLSTPTCSARPQPLLSVSPNETKKTENLQSCFPINCQQKTSKHDCYGVGGCAWCEETVQEGLLSEPFCDYQSTCPFRRCLTAKCTKSFSGTSDRVSDADDDDSKIPIIAGSAPAGGIVLILVIVAVVYVCHCRKSSDNRDADDYITPVSLENELPMYNKGFDPEGTEDSRNLSNQTVSGASTSDSIPRYVITDQRLNLPLEERHNTPKEDFNPCN